MLQMGWAFAQMLPGIGIDVAATELWQGGCDVVRVRLFGASGLGGLGCSAGPGYDFGDCPAE